MTDAYMGFVVNSQAPGGTEAYWSADANGVMNVLKEYATIVFFAVLC